MTNVTKLPDTFVARSHIRKVVRDEIQKFMDEVLCKVIGQALGDTQREIEAKIADVEFRYVGQWAEDGKYRRSNVVSQGGAIFCCCVDGTQSRPGVGSDWVLMIPKPKDGRDGKDASVEHPLEPERRTVRSSR